MAEVAIPREKVQSLKDFYKLMAATRAVRHQIMLDIAALGLDRAREHTAEIGRLASLENALDNLATLPGPDSGTEYQRLLSLGKGRELGVDLEYEITELEKDLVFLGKGRDRFLEYLDERIPDFARLVDLGIRRLHGLHFNCFITDRDGTVNNYCGRYLSSIQSVYNAVLLSRFARERTFRSLVLTSAPLTGPGLLDISITLPGLFVLAGSKGRECMDESGTLHHMPVEQAKQEVLDRFNQAIRELLAEPEYERFSLVGSGLQFKFGQTTVARQEISRSIPEEESLAFMEKVKELMALVDPEGHTLRLEDTGLDLEIMLTVRAGSDKLKEFDKGDGVAFMDRELGLNLSKGPHLVCGDTFSDLPMLATVLERTPEAMGIFVTADEDLAREVRQLCPNSLVLPEPDVLVAILGVV